MTWDHITFNGVWMHRNWLDASFWAGIERHIAELDRYEALAKARKAELAEQAA